MKSQDLDLLQKQRKEKGIPPCWCQQRVIRRAERFKSSTAITPLPDVCHLHGDTARPRARGEHPNIPSVALTNTCPPQRAAGRWKVRVLLLGSGGGHSSASRDHSAHFSPPMHNLLCSTSFKVHPCRKSPALWDALPTQPGWNLWGY